MNWVRLIAYLLLVILFGAMAVHRCVDGDTFWGVVSLVPMFLWSVNVGIVLVDIVEDR